MNTVFGIKIDELNTCYVMEFNSIEQALKECMSISLDAEDAMTICDYLNANMSNSKTYIIRLKNGK